MDDLVVLILWLILIALIVRIFVRHIWDCYTSPPGPWGLPFLGILPRLVWHELFNAQNEPLTMYRHRMGQPYCSMGSRGLWSACIGAQRVVVFHSYEAMKEAFLDKSQCFANRPQFEAYQRLTQRKGLIFTNGAVWSAHRRFSLTVLRTLGMGKSTLERKIKEEAMQLNELILRESQQGGQQQPLETLNFLVRGVSNIIRQLVFGQRCAYDDPQLEQWHRWISKVTHVEGILVVLEFFYPGLTRWGVLKLLRSGSEPVKEEFEAMKTDIRKKIHEIQLSYDPEKTPSNYVEAFLHKQATQTEGDEVFSTEQLTHACVDLFIAGMDTTTNALSWSLLYLALHPTVQSRMQREIDETIEAHSNPQEGLNMSDRTNMPFTCAVIDETLRCASPVPFSVDKCVSHDLDFRGYRIRQDDVIMTNIYAVHHDPNHWNQPEVFDPALHFMDSASQSVYQPSKYLMPFGLGPRQCLGDNLAKMEIFHFLTSVMRQFTLKLQLDSGVTVNRVLMGSTGVVRSPGPHKILFLQRKDATM